jgi:mono/diheme cytochrome c family protein
MTTTRTLTSLWTLAVALASTGMAAVLVLCASPTTAWGSSPADAALLREGRRLYHGQSAWTVAPRLAGVALPNTATAATACSACHGPRGEGRSEAGTVVPAIQWQALQQPSARLAGYQGAGAVVHAIVAGVGREGQALQAPMPRFALSPREQQALLAYLRVLGTEAETVPGVNPGEVRVASVLPLSGPQAAIGQRIRDGLAAHFAATNARGGIFGRRIALQVVDGGPDAASAARATQALLAAADDAPFALVGSLLADPDEALRNALAAHDLALVATLGLPLADSPLPQLTYLLPSLAGQLRQLAGELARQCGAGQPTLVLHPPGSAWARALQAPLPPPGDAVKDSHAAAPWRAVPVGHAGELDAALAAAEAPAVVAALDESLLARLRSAPGRRCLGTLAAVSGQATTADMPATPTAWAEVVALPMPAAAPAAATAGAAVPGRLWTVLADAAAGVLEEALARSGRGLDRARFLQALQSLHRFEPAPGLALTFTPGRRHGFDLTYLWTENHHAEPAH